MPDWQNLFKTYTKSGVYNIGPIPDLKEIEQSARAFGLAFVRIDLSGIAIKEGFLQTVARALQFPDYFGMNWDAFEECMTDLSWYPSKGYVLVFDNLEAFFQSASKEVRVMRSILKSAADFWKKQEKPFFVVLVREEKKSGDILT